MNTKSTNLKQIRKSEANAIDSGRVIKTTYYETTAKLASMKITRSIHRYTAVPNCIALMQRNEFDAMLAEVWDESTNEILVTVKRDVRGGIKVDYFIDPITGEKLRDQPWETKSLTEAAYTRKLNKYLGDLVNSAGDPVTRERQLDVFIDQVEELRRQLSK